MESHFAHVGGVAILKFDEATLGDNRLYAGWNGAGGAGAGW